MKKKNYWNNKENCFTEAKKYKSIYELERKCYGCYLGLKRNKWLYECFEQKAKPSNYWNNKERVLQEGLKYLSKMDFKKGSGGAFNAAIRNNWMNEIEKHFHKEKKMYNYNLKIHCIYVYLINETKSCYIGRTVNIHNRDLSHKRGRKHRDGSITYDVLYKYCKNSNILIPSPVVLEKKLNAKESLIREDYWLNKYKKDGWNCLNVAKTGLNSGSLGGVSKFIWNYDKCRKECLKYNNRTDLKENNYTLYKFALENKWIDEFFKPRKVKNGTWLNEAKCIEESRKYKNAQEMMRKSSGAYCAASKLGILNKLEFIKDNTESKINIQNIKTHYENGKTIKELALENNISVSTMRRLMISNGIETRKRGGNMKK